MLYLVNPTRLDQRVMCAEGGQHERILREQGLADVSELKSDEVRELGKMLGLKFGPNTAKDTMAAAVCEEMRHPKGGAT